MIWRYRALNNPVARRKWLCFLAFLILIALAYTAYKTSLGYPVKKSLLSISIFTLFVFLYGIITLGKPRYYRIDDNTVYYKPLKTDLSSIRGYDVDADRLIIKLHGAGLFSVRTLYFENLEDLREVEKFLRKIVWEKQK